MSGTRSLWQRLLAASRRAAASGALQPIATDREIIEDGAIRFIVHIVRDQVNKPKAVDSRLQPNPFLPYDPRLYVADIGARHVGLLNKFHVADHHLLIVTRDFEPQEQPLNARDFGALAMCMSEFAGLGFYNSGMVAGASQPHKHLQLMPLSTTEDGSLPTAPLLAGVTSSIVQRNAALFPCLHWAARLPPGLAQSPQQFAERLLALYEKMQREVQELAGRTEGPRPGANGPYNLLVTREWLLYIPRRVESYHDISLNSLAFAGGFLVRGEQQLNLLRSHGPLSALRHVGWPRE